MPRKSKKKLFRRGGEQKYEKFINYQKRVNLNSQPASTNLPFFKLFTYMIVFGVFVVSLPILISSLKTIFIESSITLTLPDIAFPDLSEFTLPALPTINKDTLQLPQVTFPNISVILTPIAKLFNYLFENSFSVLTNLINYLNPLPIINSLKVLTYNFYYLNFLILYKSLTFYINAAVFINPLPLINYLAGKAIIFFNFSYSLINFTLVRIINYANPMPVLIKSWYIQLFILDTSLNLFSLIFGIIGEGLSTIFNIIYTIIFFILNMVITIFTTILSAIAYVFNLIGHIFSNIFNSLKEIYLRIAEIISPAFTITKSIFKVNIEYFSRSWDSLSEGSRYVTNYYK